MPLCQEFCTACVCVIKAEQSEESERKYNIFVLFHNHGTFYFKFFFLCLDSWIIL